MYKTILSLQTRHTKDRHTQAGAVGPSFEGAAQLTEQVCINSSCAYACQSSRRTLEEASPKNNNKNNVITNMRKACMQPNTQSSITNLGQQRLQQQTTLHQ